MFIMFCYFSFIIQEQNTVSSLILGCYFCILSFFLVSLDRYLSILLILFKISFWFTSLSLSTALISPTILFKIYSYFICVFFYEPLLIQNYVLKFSNIWGFPRYVIITDIQFNSVVAREHSISFQPFKFYCFIPQHMPNSSEKNVHYAFIWISFP